jgi:hypothetical protein
MMKKNVRISSVNRHLLPQEPALVTHRQQALTKQFLVPLGADLEQYFLAMRAETDQALAPLLGKHPVKPYPEGRCTEISCDVLGRLQRRMQHPKHPVECALVAFVRRGGIIRQVWGALRERYFQSAFQFGALYVDVSNDTVFATKPKVEILPMADSGLLAIADLPHFARIAESYWGVTIYANHALPALAPIMPMISHAGGKFSVLPGCDYMIELILRSGFETARNWLVSGPPLPGELLEQLHQRGPFGTSEVICDGGQAALAACKTAREAGAHCDPAWRTARVAEYLALRLSDSQVDSN